MHKLMHFHKFFPLLPTAATVSSHRAFYNMFPSVDEWSCISCRFGVMFLNIIAKVKLSGLASKSVLSAFNIRCKSANHCTCRLQEPTLHI